MDLNEKRTNLLLEAIRKELTTIINEGLPEQTESAQATHEFNTDIKHTKSQKQISNPLELKTDTISKKETINTGAVPKKKTLSNTVDNKTASNNKKKTFSSSIVSNTDVPKKKMPPSASISTKTNPNFSKKTASLLSEPKKNLDIQSKLEKPNADDIEDILFEDNFNRSNDLLKGVGSPIEQEIFSRSALLENQPTTTNTFDEDLLRMQMDLTQSYELFQTIGGKFENINFGRLENRIKDLHLSAQNTEVNKNLRNTFEQRYKENSMDKLASDTVENFRKHPGEFGDIPELSQFFQACSQLQHGLERLKKQRNELNSLGGRVTRATDLSYRHIEEMQNLINKDIKKP